MTVITKLGELRKVKGLTQEQLARKADISTSYVQKFEQNSLSRYSVEYLNKLCKALECNIGDLLEYIND